MPVTSLADITVLIRCMLQWNDGKVNTFLKNQIYEVGGMD